MTAHAKLSASGSHRWLACPASVSAEEGLPDKSSFHANEGTAAHELAEIALTTNHDCNAWVGKTLPQSGWLVDQDMADWVQHYVNFVLASEPKDAYAGYEVRVDFSDWVPAGFGTCDALIVSGQTMHVIDLKFGKGVPVSPVNNSQGMLYALGAYAESRDFADIQTVKISIHQPRIGDGDPQTWEISIADLLKWGEWVRQRAEACLEPGAEFVPGDKQCQWCKAKPTCKALAALTEQTILADFDDVDSPDALTPAAKLTDKQLASVLRAKPLIASWLESIADYVFDRLEAGEVFPGYKLVAGKANRRWIDEAQAATTLFEMLGDAAFAPAKVLSPAQAEKALGKARAQDIAGLIIKPEGAPTLVVYDDPRPSIGVSVNDF